MGTNKETMFDESMQEDVVETFQQIKDDLHDPDVEKIVQKARSVLNKKLEKEHTENVEKGLETGLKLCKKLESAKGLSEGDIDKIISGLKYLNDPWDLIPDFISEDGMKDDAYILTYVNERIESTKAKSLTEKSKPGEIKLDKQYIVNKFCGKSGPHYAKACKENDILSPYERKALYSIGQTQMSDHQLTEKQISFYTSIIKNIILSDLDFICKNNCQECNSLKQFAKTKRNLFEPNDIVENDIGARAKVKQVEDDKVQVKRGQDKIEIWDADECTFVKTGRSTY